MIPKDCKRLAEVDFPIAEVSRRITPGARRSRRATEQTCGPHDAYPLRRRLRLA